MHIGFRLLICGILIIHGAVSYPLLYRRDAAFEAVRTRLHLDHSNKDEAPEKYFHESLFHKHYDGRFGDKRLQYEDRRNNLVALIQTYLSTMRDIGVETFIMHGTLLGWWWNGRIMPWDDDVDVMVSERSIHRLAQYYNMTVFHYSVPRIGTGRDYLLEVNPHYWNGSVDHINTIDARWIDMVTGLYIDITTLRRNQTAEALGVKGTMMVKDEHSYHYDEIFPLRDSVFERVPVKIPFAYSELLVKEYGIRALTDTYFQNHNFDAVRNEWVPLSCKEFGTCDYYRNPTDGLDLPADLP